MKNLFTIIYTGIFFVAETAIVFLLWNSVLVHLFTIPLLTSLQASGIELTIAVIKNLLGGGTLNIYGQLYFQEVEKQRLAAAKKKLENLLEEYKNV